MIIRISKNLLDNIKKTNKEFGIKDNEIYSKILITLKYDNIVNDNNKIHWKITEEKFQGIIIDELKYLIVFTQQLDIHKKIKSRNTFILQNFLPAYKIADKSKYKISISINPMNLGEKPKYADSIKNAFRMILTCDFKINKSLHVNEKKFQKIEDFVKIREIQKLKNKNNKSMYFEVQKDYISIYGKLAGACLSDTIISCKLIKLLNEDKKITFYAMCDDNIKKNYKSDLDWVHSFGINISDDNENKEETKRMLESNANLENIEFELKRNQSLFKKNIIEKYHNDKNVNLDLCFCCSYNISNNLIAAHIYRVADILNDYKKNEINFKEAYNLLTSGENGFFLCPNHDKEFEKGQIIFDITQNKFIALEKNLSEKHYKQIINSLTISSFSSHDNFSSEFIGNIKKHIIRVS